VLEVSRHRGCSIAGNRLCVQRSEKRDQSYESKNEFHRMPALLVSFLKRSFAAMLHDQTRPALARAIGPYPLHKYADAKTGLRQKLEMTGGPDQPCDESAEVDLAALQNRKAFPHHGQIAFVEVTERRWRLFAADATADQPACVMSPLHRHLCYAGQRLPVLLHGSCISHDKDLRMILHRQITADLDPSGTIGLRPPATYLRERERRRRSR
jgi:hypothetical protein